MSTESELIPRRRLYQDVLDRLLTMLNSGEFAIGSEFPPERELSERFGVGRPAVREALSTLEHLGILKVVNGKKSRLVAPTFEGLLAQIGISVGYLLNTNDSALTQLTDARSTYEAGIAWQAANLATEKDIDHLRGILDEMKAARDNPIAFSAADMAFHVAIAEMTKNPITVSIVKSLLDWLMTRYRELVRAPGLEEVTIAEHETVFEAIKRRDSNAAASEILRHIKRADGRFRRAGDFNAGD
ncbi:FCD domain-containing protein [Paraburkholderia dipogonis]|nr:FCD domain-containing protein [Paraburkholderia dipogonis]